MNDTRDVAVRLDDAPVRLAESVQAATRHLAQGDLIDALRTLEDLKNVATAVQAVAAVNFARHQRAEQIRRGVPAERVGRGVAEQIALARRESPHRGAIFLGVASMLVAEMPFTLDAMAAGVLTEHRAQILVHETSCVSREVRVEVDHAVAGDLVRLSRLGTRRLADLVRVETYRRDPASVVARIGHAASERFVAGRPAPDCMTRLTALLPVAQGVAVLAALRRAATTAHATGDPRTQEQVMADELVVRVTGRAATGAVPVALHLVMPVDTLLNAGDQPGRVHGHGPIPAEIARRLVVAAPAVESWVRKLYATPKGGLVAMESGSRFFPDGLAEFISLRDEFCRTPYCDAAIRHIDHIIPAADDGPTDAANGQGLCERCNHARQAPGWTARRFLRRIEDAPTAADPDRSAPPGGDEHGHPPTARSDTWGDAMGTWLGDPHEVVITTPTGHHHLSAASSLS